jgi:hypothetical protein
VTNKSERGELRSTPRFLRALLGRSFTVRSTERYQPLPLHRLVFHPQLGRPTLGRVPWVQRSVSLLERGAARLLPRIAWAYVHVRAEAP